MNATFPTSGVTWFTPQQLDERRTAVEIERRTAVEIERRVARNGCRFSDPAAMDALLDKHLSSPRRDCRPIRTQS